MNAAKFFIASLLFIPTIAGRAEEWAISTRTAPQFLVDAQIVDTELGQILVAARPYYETVEQSYHAEPSLRQLRTAQDGNATDRRRYDAVRRVETRTKQLAILQSAIVKIAISQSSLSKLDGTEATLDELRETIADERSILFLPEGASLHPGIVAMFKPDTLVISQLHPGSAKIVARPLVPITRTEK